MSSEAVNIAFTDLRKLLGRRVQWDGVECEIVEILEDGPALILQECNDHHAIQADQHGDAHRHAPVMHSVAVLNAEKTNYDLGFLQLNL